MRKHEIELPREVALEPMIGYSRLFDCLVAVVQKAPTT